MIARLILESSGFCKAPREPVTIIGNKRIPAGAITGNGLRVIQSAAVFKVVRPRTAKAGRAQKPVSTETVKLCNSGEYACTCHIGKGHYLNVGLANVRRRADPLGTQDRSWGPATGRIPRRARYVPVSRATCGDSRLLTARLTVRSTWATAGPQVAATTFASRGSGIRVPWLHQAKCLRNDLSSECLCPCPPLSRRCSRRPGRGR